LNREERRLEKMSDDMVGRTGSEHALICGVLEGSWLQKCRQRCLGPWKEEARTGESGQPEVGVRNVHSKLHGHTAA
jgi:hypothetical protein